MTYQPRTRTKSVMDISEYIQDLGVCCLPDGTKEETDYNDCIGRNGYFNLGKTVDEVDCISTGATGCCCACAYVNPDEMNEFIGDYQDYMGGLGDNVSKCHCENGLGGVWAEGKACSVYETAEEIVEFCKASKDIDGDGDIDYYDVRFPGACCQEVYENDELIGMTCDNVCNGSDCIDLNGVLYYGIDFDGSGKLCGSSSDPDYDGFRDDIDVYPTDCGWYTSLVSNCDGACCAETVRNGWNCDSLTEDACYNKYVDDDGVQRICWHGCESECLIEGHLICELNPDCTDSRPPLPDELVSACCILNYDGTAYSCSDHITESQCHEMDGIWAGMTGDMPIYCGSNPCPSAPRSSGDSDISGRNDYMSISQSEIDNLDIGDSVGGGIFFGVFEAGPPVNGKGSMVIGNQYTGKVQEYEARGWGAGTTTNKKWAIIVDDIDTKITDSNMTTSNTIIVPTSYYDGHYNTYGNKTTFYGLSGKLISNIGNMTRKGYTDWYIASQDELAYINYILNYTTAGNILNSDANGEFKTLNGKYLTSTMFSHKDITNPEKTAIDKQDISSIKYVYTQLFNQNDDNGFVQLVPDKNLTSSKTLLRCIRRIRIL
ncbi:hypothetical protein CL614_07035 [archaeon]|nr:hypothetical protein [archaeon]